MALAWAAGATAVVISSLVAPGTMTVGMELAAVTVVGTTAILGSAVAAPILILPALGAAIRGGVYLYNKTRR